MAEDQENAEKKRNDDIEDTGLETEKPKKFKKILGIVFGVLFFGGILAGGSWYYFFKPSTVPENVKDLRYLYHYELPEILVNLRSKAHHPRFLKLQIIIEGYDPKRGEHIKALKKFEPRIIDQFQSFLRDLFLEDIEGAQGIQRLREQMTKRVNTILHGPQVSNILFSEMLVQ